MILSNIAEFASQITVIKRFNMNIHKNVIPIRVSLDQLDSNDVTFNNVNNTIGISIVIARDCNLKCDFCIERQFDEINKDNLTEDQSTLYKKYADADHYVTVAGIERVIENVKIVMGRFSNWKANYSISILGGELFQDRYKDDVFQAYENLLSEINNIANRQHKKVDIMLMTNLITKNPMRIGKLAKRHNCIVNCSFDFVGRFRNQKVIDLFKCNLQVMKDTGCKYVVNICQSRTNIEKILNDDSTWIDLYNNHDIHFEQFQNVGNPTFDVDDDVLFEFYKKLAMSYPNVINIDSNKKQKFFNTCITIFANNINWQCCDHKLMMKKYINQKNCMVCEWFTNCELQDCYLVGYQSTDCFLHRFLSWRKSNNL